MKINRIDLENIKKYTSTSVELSSGINFISGKNGAGKTTIIESIGFALFDYKVTKQNFAQYFIRKGEKKGQVRIYFTDKFGDEYITDRKIAISSAGSSWTIKSNKDGEEIAVVSKDEDVKAWLKNHLEFYPDDNITDIYANIVSVPQGEFTVAFLETDTTRKAIFDPIFNLESYRNAYNNIKLEAGVTIEIRNIENEINVRLGEIKRLDEAQAEMQKLLSDVKLEQKEYEEKHKVFEGLKSDFDTMDKNKQLYEKLDTDKKIQEVQIEKTDEYIIQKSKDIEVSKLALEMVSKHQNDYEEYAKLENQKTELDKKFKDFIKAKESILQFDNRIETGAYKIEERDAAIEKERQELNIKKQELIKNNAENETLRAKLLEETSEIEKDKKNIDKLKSDMNYIAQNSIKLQHLKKDILNLLRNFETPRRELKKLEDIKQASKNIKDSEITNEATLKNIEIIINIANELITAKVSETKESDQEIEKITKEIEQISTKIKNISEVLADTSLNVDESIIAKIFEKHYDEKINTFNNVNLKYEKLKTELEHKEIQLEKEKEEYKNKQTQIKNEEEEKNKWVIALEKLKIDRDEMLSSFAQFENIESKMDAVNEKLFKLKPVNEIYISNKSEAEKYEKLMVDLNFLESNKKVKGTNLKKLVEELDNIKKVFDLDKYSSIKYRFEEDRQQIIKLEEQLKTHKEQLEKYNKEIEYMKGIKQTIVEDENKIKKLEKVNEVIKKLRNVIKNAPEHIAEILIQNVANKASEIYSGIAADSSKLDWEKNYEVVLKDLTDEVEIRKEFKQLSGGEQITAALAIRIAMLELLTKLGIGILDEPTINMDTNRRERLAEVIESIGSNFRQLIIVSHDDTFQSVTENVVVLG